LSLKASARDGALTLDIVVAPRASHPGLGPVVGDRLRVAVAAPPVDGKANATVIELLAKTLGVPRGAVEIVRGETGRKKTVRLHGVTLAAVLAACLE
jgi:uncharacterized protein (TIGR00251 family)